jgi:hypothetical protein
MTGAKEIRPKSRATAPTTHTIPRRRAPLLLMVMLLILSLLHGHAFEEDRISQAQECPRKRGLYSIDGCMYAVIQALREIKPHSIEAQLRSAMRNNQQFHQESKALQKLNYFCEELMPYLAAWTGPNGDGDFRSTCTVG